MLDTDLRQPHVLSMIKPALGTALVFCAAHGVLAEEKDPRPAAGLQDNSFLIEEAYNQEAGVVQHISSLRRLGRDWFFAFTQEWPMGTQTHQFSYTIPYSWLRSEEQKAAGIGDLMLNYRYQVLSETDNIPAFAPRLSLIVPSGKSSNGLGVGSTGLQVNLPFSKIVSDRVTLHFNAGLTSYFNVYQRRPTSFNLGGSAIYAFSREFNFMVETLAEWTATATPASLIEREFAFTVSPGLRYAFNLDAGQLVVGAAVPVRFSQGRPSGGVFAYLSFEHSFLKPASSPLGVARLSAR